MAKTPQQLGTRALWLLQEFGSIRGRFPDCVDARHLAFFSGGFLPHFCINPAQIGSWLMWLLINLSSLYKVFDSSGTRSTPRWVMHCRVEIFTIDCLFMYFCNIDSVLRNFALLYVQYTVCPLQRQRDFF